MNIKIPYGNSFQRFKIDERLVIDIIEPANVKTGNYRDILINALVNPIGSQDFDSFTNRSDKFLIIVNDATRPTPTGKILEVVLPHLIEQDYEFIIATGSHRAPTEKELKQIFGKHLINLHGKINIHNAREDTCLYEVGKTSLGTDVRMNRILENYRHIIVIGSIEPHYFAGFTGGRKAFLPGISGWTTIEQNHKLILTGLTGGLKLTGNPLNDDIDEALKMLHNKVIFSIQVVLNNEGEIADAFAGDIRESFIIGTRRAEEIYTRKIEEQADVIITVVKRPMDLDLYQSLKAVENCKLVSKESGIIILVSECHDGIGPSNFYQLLSVSRDPEKIMEKIRQEYRLGYHKAAKIAELMKRTKIWTVTSIQDDLLENISIRSFKNVQDSIDAAMQIFPKNPRFLIVLDGTVMVPRI